MLNPFQDAIKLQAKAILARTVLCLPWGAREAIFEALVGKMSARVVLARIARRMSITHIGADGRWGLMISAADDGVVLPRYARSGDWAPYAQALLDEYFVASGGTYFDIGANIGLTTVPVARNARVRCHAFEPEPTNFANLAENVRRNTPHGNVTLHRTALHDRPGPIKFALADDMNIGDHRIATGDTRRATIEVPGAMLDAMEIAIEGPVAAKIDTQGAEPLVIAGGRRVLGQVGLLMIEFSPKMIVDLGGDPEIIFDYLGGFDEIALLPGDSTAVPVFGPVKHAIATLREAFESARHNEYLYWDVYARRPGAAQPDGVRQAARPEGQ